MTLVEAVRLPPSPDFHKGACERRITVGFKSSQARSRSAQDTQESPGPTPRTKPHRSAALIPYLPSWCTSEEQINDWHLVNDVLLSEALRGDSQSFSHLLSLIRRDPRILYKNSIVASHVLECKKAFRAADAEVAASASKRLNKLARAIADKSEPEPHPDLKLWNAYRQAMTVLRTISEEIRKRNKAGKGVSAGTLARDFGQGVATESDVRELVTSSSKETTIANGIAGRSMKPRVGKHQAKKRVQKFRRFFNSSDF